MEFVVETPTGEKLTIKVGANEKFSSILARLIEQIGEPPSSVRSYSLIGPVISGDGTPRNHQFKNGDAFHLVSNLVQIFVNTPTVGKITLEVNRYDTIIEVKNLIEEQTEVLSRRQLLLFADSPLEDGKTVGDSNLKNGDTIELIIDIIEIFIKLSTGKRILLEVNRNDAIESVKNLIQAKEGIPQQDQDLFYGRKKLEDGHTLQEFEIPSGSTLTLRLNEIKILISMPSKEKFLLDVNLNETISSVKAKIEQKKGIRPENQFFCGSSGDCAKDGDTVKSHIWFSPSGQGILKMADPNMSISVAMFTGRIGRRFSLNVNRNDTIAAVNFKVKSKIAQEDGDINLENHFLCLGDVRLRETSTLQRYLTKNRFTGIFELRHFCDMSVFITWPAVLSIAFYCKDAVKRVKELIQDKGGIPPDEQSLIFNGCLLDDSRTMVSYNIKNGDTVQLVLRLRG